MPDNESSDYPVAVPSVTSTAKARVLTNQFKLNWQFELLYEIDFDDPAEVQRTPKLIALASIVEEILILRDRYLCQACSYGVHHQSQLCKFCIFSD